MNTFQTFQWGEITQMEDPVSGGLMDQSHFFETYIKVLETLDGSDMLSYVELWFIRCPVQRSSLRFRDSDSRSDWVDMAIEFNCIPTIGEIQEGENIKDKKIRKEKEKPKIKRTNSQPIRSKPIKEDGGILKQIEVIKLTINKLDAKIIACTNPEIKKQLEEKRERSYINLNKLNDLTM